MTVTRTFPSMLGNGQAKVRRVIDVRAVVARLVCRSFVEERVITRVRLAAGLIGYSRRVHLARLITVRAIFRIACQTSDG